MATTQVETVSTGADKAKLFGVVALALAGLVSYYLLAAQPGYVRWASLLVALLLAAVLFGVSQPGKRLVAFARDSWKEAQKVVWPTKQESIQMTGYVFAFVAVMALFLWLTDKSLEWVIYGVILGWR
jgi:preprotein translocase subunit SecE